ncbi:MAG: hypothetical protein ACI9G1_003071 [Pirellulaceae bacterium]|jgi:hypothetical protein
MTGFTNVPTAVLVVANELPVDKQIVTNTAQ